MIAKRATYARNTSVSTVASRAEIERTLKRFGAKNVACLEWQGKALVLFECQGLRIRFTADIPDCVTTAKGRRPRNPAKAVEQEMKVRWRGLLVSIIGRMSEMESGTKFELAFADKIVMPNGQTLGEWAVPQMQEIYASGNMPPLLALPAPEM